MSTDSGRSVRRKTIPRVRRTRAQGHENLLARVQTHTRGTNRVLERPLSDHALDCNFSIDPRDCRGGPVCPRGTVLQACSTVPQGAKRARYLITGRKSDTNRVPTPSGRSRQSFRERQTVTNARPPSRSCLHQSACRRRKAEYPANPQSRPPVADRRQQPADAEPWACPGLRSRYWTTVPGAHHTHRRLSPRRQGIPMQGLTCRSRLAVLR